jgi:hypothetical protein
MLTSGMRKAFDAGTAAALAAGARALLNVAAHPRPGTPPLPGQVDGATFIAKHRLREEVFGPAALLVRGRLLARRCKCCRPWAAALTVTLWGAEADMP